MAMARKKQGREPEANTEKVAAVGVVREDGWLYFIDKESKIARSKMIEAGTSKGAVPPTEIVADPGHVCDPNFIYFLDDDGDLARCPRPARKARTPLGAIDRTSAASAQTTIESLLPERATRQLAMALIADGYTAALAAAPNGTFVSLFEHRIRLNVGSVEVATFDRDRLHFVLDELPEALRSPDVMVTRKPYSRLMEGMPSHVSVDFGAGHSATYVPALKSAFLRAVAVAATTTPNPASRASHSPGLAELLETARQAPPATVHREVKLPERRLVSTEVFVRDEAVKAAVRTRASGTCECCLNPAPFLDDEGQPFLEVHHLTWLVNGGPDSIDNTAAVCPNCHRRLHHGPERSTLTEQVRSRVVARNATRT